MNPQDIIDERPCGCVVTFFAAANYRSSRMICCCEHKHRHHDLTRAAILDCAKGVRDGILSGARN